MQEKELSNFDSILEFVRNDLKYKLKEENIIRTMSANVKWGNNIIIKLIPLILKNIILKLSYMEIRKYTTTTFSNVGRISVDSEYEPYIDKFLVLLAPEPVEKIKCSACSFKDNFVFTFTSILEDTSIEEAFFKYLKEQGIEIELESNGVQYDLSRIN